MATETLHIYAFGLKEDTTLTLIFDLPGGSKPFCEHFPIVWKVFRMTAGGHCKATLRYTNRIAFGDAHINSDFGYLVDSTAWSEITDDGVSQISHEYCGGRKRSGPKKANGMIHVGNKTKKRASLSLGFIRGTGISQRYTPIVLWKDIAAKSHMSCEFRPVLSAYITQTHQASEMLRWEAEVDPVWSCDLSGLDDVTEWHLVEDTYSGAFYLEPGV